MGESAGQFLNRAIATGGRIVSSNDLSMWQWLESQSNGNSWISPDWFGWAILPWDLTTGKDRDRERVYFGNQIGIYSENDDRNCLGYLSEDSVELSFVQIQCVSVPNTMSTQCNVMMYGLTSDGKVFYKRENEDTWCPESMKKI